PHVLSLTDHSSTESYTLSLHDALPILQMITKKRYLKGDRIDVKRIGYRDMFDIAEAVDKLRSSSVVNGQELRDALGLEHSDEDIDSEEHTSELQSRFDLVCRLLLEKKK